MFNFFRKTKKSTHHEKNQDLISFGIKNGDNPEKDHVVEFAFYGDAEKLNKLKKFLILNNYLEVLGQSEDMLIVSKSFKLEIDLVDKEEQTVIDLGHEYGVGYDGWSTYPVK